jgi:nicotinamide-nucleotide amidase
VASELRDAEILAVGSELLTPYRLDTNSLFVTARLNDRGIVVRRKVVVPDDRAQIGNALQSALARADLVVTIGGLGPTEDDVTREAVADVLSLDFHEDAAILAAIRTRFERRGLTMPERNRRQAMVPDGATVLANPRGTAPGLWIETVDRAVVLLPGPLRELQPMFETHVDPRLAERTMSAPLGRRVLRITGRTESHVEEIAQPIYATLGTATVAVQTTILASPGLIELHLEGRGQDEREIQRVLAIGADRLAASLAPYVFSTDGRTLEAIVGDLLVERGWRIAVAESCTAGLVLARLTEVPGSSRWVLGGVVAYANDVKISHLAVNEAMLNDHGAVSEPVALAMASGVRARLSADVGLAITGIAGPDGGTPEKPVGTVCLAIDGPERRSLTLRLTGDRAAVRTQAVQAALDLVRRAALSRD